MERRSEVLEDKTSLHIRIKEMFKSLLIFSVPVIFLGIFLYLWVFLLNFNEETLFETVSVIYSDKKYPKIVYAVNGKIIPGYDTEVLFPDGGIFNVFTNGKYEFGRVLCVGMKVDKTDREVKKYFLHKVGNCNSQQRK